MASEWSAALSHGLVEESVVTSPDGSGRISASANWPLGSRETLTRLFRQCVQELWSALDSLVVETVEAFSVQHHPRNPERPRFFPIADSDLGFDALLEQSCLDGILRPQYQMVRDCQPFIGAAGNERVDRMRNGLRRLVEWENSLDNGAQLCAWATPVEPRIFVEMPVELDLIRVQGAGPIEVERTLATFQLSSFEFGRPVSGQAGTFVDLCLAEGFDPADSADTFEMRLGESIDVVVEFAIGFAWFSTHMAGSKRVLLGSRSEAGQSWVTATDSPRRWSEDELVALANSESGLGRVIDVEDFTLVVSTPSGVFERVIHRATPLREHDRRGTAAESAIRDAAATWGLPDFVMVPSVERKGAGVREISDGLLVVRDQGVIVQAKSREIDSGTLERESSWINKQIAAGSRQIDGTARRLRSAVVRMQNGRGRNVRVDGPSIKWVGVIVIEHPSPPEDFMWAVAVRARVPFIALLRRDWEFLFDQLRSTHAVVSYLHRVGKSTDVLGAEPERYYELAAADEAAAPEPVDPTIGPGERRSVPLLPTAPAGTEDDEAHGMFRRILEDIANTEVDLSNQDARQTVLASLDALPVGFRSDLGRLLLDALSTARRTDEGIAWRFRTYLVGPEHTQLGFGVCSTFNETTKGAFSAWLLLRHHERGERVGRFDGLESIGVLLTPRDDGYREWDTTLLAIQGDPGVSGENLEKFRALWNKHQ